MTMVTMILVAMRNGCGEVKRATNHKAGSEAALVSHAACADMDPEDVNMTMNVMAMWMRKPSAVSGIDAGPMLSLVLGGWPLLELYLGRAETASVLIMTMKATLTMAHAQVKATAMRYEATWNAKRWGKVLEAAPRNVINLPTVKGGRRVHYEKKAYGDMRMLIIVNAEVIKEVMEKFCLIPDVQLAETVTTWKSERHHTDGRSRVGNNYVNTSAASRPPQAEARDRHAQGGRALRPLPMQGEDGLIIRRLGHEVE